MQNKTARLKTRSAIFWFMAVVLAVAGCAGPQGAPPQTLAPQVPAATFPSFVVVTAQEGDTFSSLAAAHLKDPSLGWLISDFNDIQAITPGVELVIPLKPYERGGLSRNKYQTVPIISYHKFSETRVKDKMTVTVAAFEEQMRLLKDRGYNVITLDQLADFLEFRAQIPKKSVVITIDDGWRSFYDLGYPILKKYGYPATLFIYTELITGSRKTLSWDQVREVAANGIDIQNHTKTHRDLSKPAERESFREYFDAVQAELTVAAKTIKDKTGREPKYLAYPFGSTNHLMIALLRKHGYRGAFTVQRGGNPFFLNDFLVGRSMIYGDMDIQQFERNLVVLSQEALK